MRMACSFPKEDAEEINSSFEAEAMHCHAAPRPAMLCRRRCRARGKCKAGRGGANAVLGDCVFSGAVHASLLSGQCLAKLTKLSMDA